MKKLLLFAFVFSSLLASAQQETFETIKETDYHPFKEPKKSFYSIPPSNIDEKGRTWYEGVAIDNNFRFYNNKDTTKIKIDFSPKQKFGYQYSVFSNVLIDEFKSKLVIIRGYKDNYYDFYLARYDSLGKVTYTFLRDLVSNDSSMYLESFQSVGGKALFILRDNRFIWEGDPSANIIGSSIYNYYYLIPDKKGTLFVYSHYKNSLMSFHSDGSFKKRLPTNALVNFDYNDTTKTLTILSKTGIYELNGENEKEIILPLTTQLLNSESIRSLSRKMKSVKMDIVMSQKGFNVREGNSSTTYLFAEKNLGVDSLKFEFYPPSVNLQEDSTLVLGYQGIKDPSKFFLFTYKNGFAKFHKEYSLPFTFITDSSVAFYVAKDQTYFYSYEQYSSIIDQVKKDTIKTSIVFDRRFWHIYRWKADKNFLWIMDGNYKIIRLRHDTYFVRGNVFYDADKNGFRTGDEYGYPKIKLIAQPSGLQLTPDYDGNFAFKGEFGNSYKIDVADSTRFSWISKDIYTIGVKLKDEKPEVNASFWLPRARCFTKLPASFYLQNTGVVPVEKVVIRLVPNKMKLLQNSTLVDTATFTYQNLGVHQSTSLAYDIEWPEAELTGQTATLKTITDLYVNGAVASRKIDSVQTIIRCSYDPNDKSVTPSGIGEKFYTLKTSTLQYQIRFENTGNDTAYHVVIQDTLDKNLDFSTFEVLGSSHKMNTEISKNGVVGFHFNYIMLPDSAKDKKGAQGFVRFSIKPKATVANNTLLCNKAAIYFDQNKPVITNSTCNLLVDKIPTNPLGIENSETSTGNTIYPNPTSDWIFLPKEAEETAIYNILGSQVLKSNETKVNMAGIEEGIYVAKVRAKNGKVSTHKISVVK